MLAEGFVALIALVTVMINAPEGLKGLTPGTIYGNGIGRFMTLIIGPEHLAFAITFGAMAFSTFVFDTLDVCTRLGRYIIQELCGWRGKAGALVGTLLTVALPVYFISFAQEGMCGKILDALRRFQPIARRANAAFRDLLALSGAPAHRVYAHPYDLRPHHHALGFGQTHALQFAGHSRFRY
ncbi:MAG: carbon starvation CstA 5TM domain-containing protein [Pyrinomonadaceae bacterium]